jgi:hypothetical protein
MQGNKQLILLGEKVDVMLLTIPPHTLPAEPKYYCTKLLEWEGLQYKHGKGTVTQELYGDVQDTM